MPAMPASAVVRPLPNGALQLICPNCGSTKQLTDQEARGQRTTTCPSPSCELFQRIDWHEWMRRHAVRK